MGDRRIADRRSPEEGVIKIRTKKLFLYIIVILFLAISVILNIILGIIYFNSKKENTVATNSVNDLSVDESMYESMYENMYNCDLTITGDKKSIKPGETITYEIKAENINAGTGIVMFETLLDYDKDLFECDVITDENSEWSKTSLIEDYLTLSRKDLLPSTKDQTIGKLVVKAKDDVQVGQYMINLIDLKFTMDGSESFTVLNKTINIDILDN